MNTEVGARTEFYNNIVRMEKEKRCFKIINVNHRNPFQPNSQNMQLT